MLPCPTELRMWGIAVLWRQKFLSGSVKLLKGVGREVMNPFNFCSYLNKISYLDLN